VAHAVELSFRSNGTALDTWDEYRVTLDMFMPGSPWTFTLWRSSAREAAWRRLLNSARLGDQVIFKIDGATQLNGRIERRRTVVSREGAQLVITGRDLAGPAIDWDADPRTTLRNVTLSDVLTALFRPLGLDVVIGASADAAREVQSRSRPGSHGAYSNPHRRSKRVDLSHARPGERVWQVADSIVRRLGLMMWVAPSADGQLAVIVDVPQYEGEAAYQFKRRIGSDGQVTAASNILESEFDAQIRDIPTVVHAFGRAPRGDVATARHHAGVSAGDRFFRNANPNDPHFLALDSAALPNPGDANAAVSPSGSATISTRLPYQNDDLARYPLVLDPLPPQPRFLHTRRAMNPATGRQEATRFMAEAMRRFRTYTCTVQGHGQTVNGQARLYAINTMAHVYDRISEIDEDMLITGVEFAGSRTHGQTTRLTLGTKGAVALSPEP
jgi:prophage tail gpP-like protein